MALDFLNDARSYDANRECVSFWGHDSAFEVTFKLDQTALRRFTGQEKLTEPVALRAFDANIQSIRDVARKLYSRTTKRYCEISADDLR
jgi:hypothetical protein